jgi:hypothetical protein
METPILLCGNAVAIIDVKLNDVLFGGIHVSQCLSRHDGNKQLFTLVKNVLISNPTTGAKKDRRHDITSIIDALVANDARFLRCDTEKECFFPNGHGFSASQSEQHVGIGFEKDREKH